MTKDSRACGRALVAMPTTDTDAANGPALRLLGVAAWRMAAGAWHALPRKDAALVARLALAGPQPRQAMAAWLWPEVPMPRANANLRQRLFRLRRQCGELVQEDEARLALGAGVDCDLGAEHCSDTADLGAPLLDGLAAEDDEVQAWLEAARSAWAVRRLDLLAERAEQQAAAGQLAAALASTEQLLAAEPLQEHAWRRLMRLHSRRGDRAAALAAFERCEQVLREELGVKPSPETLALLHGVETMAGVAPGATGGAAGPGPLPASLLRPPRLVGRERQMRAMAAAWQAGTGFVLVGQAGHGKSRLLGELSAMGPGRVLASARPGDENLSYGALVRLLRAMARAAPRPAALWPQGPAARELARLLPELGSAPTAPGLQTLLHDALEAVFGNAAAAGLDAVLFDDLQHADEATRTVLRRVLGVTGLHWGLACRPDGGVDLGGWLGSSARLQAVALGPLEDAQVDELLASLAMREPWLPRLLPALKRQCGGNPLFLLETLKHLVLHGDAALPDAAGAALPLPASVEALLAQRLERLSPPALDLARVAAVAGGDFDAEVAADVLGCGLLALAGPWAELQQAQVLQGEAAGGEAFVHESLLHAVLRGLPRALRAPLHARVARSLRARQAPAQHVAQHFAAAGDWQAAAPLALAAAAESLRLGRSVERLAQLRQAAAWFAQAGDAQAAFDAELASAGACLAHEGLEAAQALVDALLARAISPAQRVAVQLAQAELGVSGYAADRALAAASAARAEAEPGSTAELRACVLQAAALARSSDVTAALAATQALLPRLERLDDEALAAGLWAQCAVVFNANGDTDACLRALERQRSLAQRIGHSELEAAALASLGGQWVSLGEVQAAIETGRQAVELHRRIGADHTALLCEINLATALIGNGELHGAQGLLQSAARGLAGRSEGGDLRRVVAEMEAAVHLRQGQPAQALQRLSEPGGAAAEAGLALARQLNRLALRGLALEQQGDAAGAAACWQALGEKVPRGSATGLHLRSRVLASRVLSDEAALAELAAVLVAAEATRFPAGQALARMERAARALQRGQPEAALDDAQALQALRPRARHLFVDEQALAALLRQVFDGAAATARG